MAFKIYLIKYIWFTLIERISRSEFNRRLKKIHISSFTKTKILNMEITETLKYIRIYVTTAKLMGVIDAEFDTGTQCLVQVNTVFHRARHIFTLLVISLVRCSMIFCFIQSIATRKFTFKDKFDILHMAYCLICLYTVGNHWINYWKRSGIPSTINSFLVFYQKFESK